ncbi:hypothetical protein ACFVJ4_13040 [Streptomyces sp. NPDC127178]|uniref:hypothetical protein n=1 Tax=unclassified Streptomyces TaxID=2593676 RepID=UPI00364146F5
MKSYIARSGAAVAALATCLVGVGTTAEAQPLASNSAVDAHHSTEWRSAPVALRGDPLLRQVVNVRSLGEKCGKKPLAVAEGRGRMTLRIDETRSVTSTLSKDIKIDLEGISAGVGWDVTKSRSVTVSGSKEVPHGKYGALRAYTKYSGKKFDVFSGLKGIVIQKDNTAYKPVGVCFKYSQR